MKEPVTNLQPVNGRLPVAGYEDTSTGIVQHVVENRAPAGKTDRPERSAAERAGQHRRVVPVTEVGRN